MSDPLTVNRGRQVSRQLTDTERALDDQVDSHLNQQPMQAIAGESRYGYSWLEDDLKQRAMITEQLGQERQLAAASGALQDMDRRFNQETEDEADAVEASRALNQFRAANPRATFGDAVNAVTADRPDRWGNKFFTDQIDKMKGFHETDMERIKREGDLGVSIISNNINSMTGMAKADALRSPAGQEYLKQANDLIMKKELSGYKLLPHEEELKLETMKNDLKVQKIRSEEIDFADTSFEGKAKLAYFMNESGFDVQNLDKLGSTLQGKKGVIEAIAHPTFLSRNPAIAERLKSSIQTLDNPDAKPADLAKAEADMALVAGAHSKYTSASALSLQEEDRAMKWGAERGKSLADLNEEVLSITTKNTEGKRSSTVPVEDEILNTYEGWMKSQVTADPSLKSVYDEEIARIDKIRSSKDAQAKINEARYAAGDFAMKAAKISPSRETKKVTPTPGAGSPSPAAAKPTALPKTRVNPKDGKEYVLNEKDGKYYLPR